MTGKILVLTAIDDELDKKRAPDGVEVVFTGVGKINTTIATLIALQARKPSLVVNYGTAGKISESLRGLVEVAHVIQRDMNAEPLAPRGATPYAPELERLSSGHGEVTCGTGDSFVTTSDPWLNANHVDIVDMELFALASVCRRLGIPWRAFKFITDDANDFAHQHWIANVANGQDLFWDVMKDLRA
jgi:adenosylhomocysteine nucleosidase